MSFNPFDPSRGEEERRLNELADLKRQTDGKVLIPLALAERVLWVLRQPAEFTPARISHDEAVARLQKAKEIKAELEQFAAENGL